MMLETYQKITLYALVLIGLFTGIVWHNLVFCLISLVLVSYLIHVTATGYYFYRAMSILILAALFMIIIGIRNNYTNSFLVLFMMVDVIL